MFEPRDLVFSIRSRMDAWPDCTTGLRSCNPASCADKSAFCDCASAARSAAWRRFHDLHKSS